MRIGELAKRSACEVETIRYYEREGLLPPPARSEGNYRQYSEADAERLLFIRHCRSLGMSLDEVRTLQRFQAQPELACDEIDAMLDRHLLQIEAQIAALQRLQRQLRKLRATCQSQMTTDRCGILQHLENAAHGNECICHSEPLADAPLPPQRS